MARLRFDISMSLYGFIAGPNQSEELHVVPVVLGAGARLFDNLEGVAIGLECTRVVVAPGVTHLRFRVGK
jgi:hypothetical protein